MTTCFIFVKYCSDEGCLSITLTPHGDIEAPLATRTYSEIKQTQINATTIIVVPTEHFTLHRIELPWLPEKKARLALPFALEDKLAENLDDLHFSFDKNHYSNGYYLVAVGKKSYLTDLVFMLESHQISFEIITLDWFALANNEVCALDTNLLIHDELHFSGSLPKELAPRYLEKMPAAQAIYAFTNTDPSFLSSKSEYIEINSSLWLAKRLQNMKLLNLIQGSLSHGKNYSRNKLWYKAAIIMSLVWILSVLICNSIKIITLNAQLKEIDNKIATIYHHFFPKAQQIINPRFRIGQLMKSQKNQNDASFWVLLNKLTIPMKKNASTIESIKFQNQILLVTLVADDFDALEALQTDLKNGSVKVKQSQASSRGEQVIATLELSL